MVPGGAVSGVGRMVPGGGFSGSGVGFGHLIIFALLALALRLAYVELTWGNRKSQFLGFQEEYTPEVEIPGRGVGFCDPRPGLLFTIAPRKI